MGKASKWFRGLLGLKRVAELPSKEKPRWSFVKSYREREKEKDQTTAGGITPPEWAAIKIQAAFRGSLARKALRALKGLVKLQALVRGHIERKRTAEWLQRVQALLRVQAQIWNAKSSSTAHLHLHGPAPATPDKYDQSSSVLKRNSSKSRIDDEQAHMTTSKRGNLFYSSSQKQKQQAMVSDHINYSPSNSPQASSNLGSPLTPSRSTDGSRSHLSGYSEPEYPSYMAYTESSKAKLRSLSAPKQRYSLHQSKLHTQRIHATFNNKPAYLATARLDNFGLGLPPLPPLPYKY